MLARDVPEIRQESTSGQRSASVQLKRTQPACRVRTGTRLAWAFKHAVRKRLFNHDHKRLSNQLAPWLFVPASTSSYHTAVCCTSACALHGRFTYCHDQHDRRASNTVRHKMNGSPSMPSYPWCTS